MIEIIPSVPSLSKALQHKQNEHLNISSNIQINCTKSSSIKIQWTIFSCLSTCSTTVQINQPILTSEKYLFIPEETLPSGFYEIQLTVSMIVDPTLFASSSTFIEIIRSTIFTKLISSTASIITHDVEDDLILDPGEFSFDLYRIIWNREVDEHYPSASH